jgi:spermidine/putrescine ABC transporter ATP-binding subunit
MSEALAMGEATARPMVEIRSVAKRFGEVAAVDDVSLDIQANELFALLGPSGCGKTTLLRMLAGFERASAGRILIDGEDMGDVPPNRRPVNMVFQSYAVFPHMSVARNVAYGLEVTGTPRAEIGPRVADALAMVRLAGLESREPDQLSGGQRQRVALARALIKRPKVLLLDEPLSALDKKLREEMQLELVRLQHEVGITFVIVTHDQEEALSMADRIAVMDKGRILQIAPPAELYEAPNCRMVAEFIGTTNLFAARVLGSTAGGGLRLEAEGLGLVELPDAASSEGPAASDLAARGEVGLAVRPEKVQIGRERPVAGLIAVQGRITQLAYFGDYSHVYVDSGTGEPVTCYWSHQQRQESEPLRVGEPCWVAWRPTDCIVLTE